eukprot:6839621-Pyramimonas_sp.AAC.1
MDAGERQIPGRVRRQWGPAQSRSSDKARGLGSTLRGGLPGKQTVNRGELYAATQAMRQVQREITL